MECTCGAELRPFWIWRDGNGTLHASRFRPSVGFERGLLASSPRDALTAVLASSAPRHLVVAADDTAVRWSGRCSAPSELLTAAPSVRLAPTSVQ